MSDQKLQGKTPTYSFQGSSPAEESLEIARIHHKEAKQLFEGAKAAEAEGRAEEARLLLDLAVARRERAEEFERVAQGQCGDPIVTEILDWQEDLCETYTPPTLEFHSKEDLAAAMAAGPDAILLPKIDGPGSVMQAARELRDSGAPERTRLWAMMETPMAILHAEIGRAHV